MHIFFFIEPIIFFNGHGVISKNELSLSKNNSFSRNKNIFLPSLKSKIDLNQEKIKGYIDCLPGDFLNDRNAPSPFSFSWLQRMGRMDIFSEKLESKTKEEGDFTLQEWVKSDPIFRLPKKKKKKIQKDNFDLVIGRKKEEKMILSQNNESYGTKTLFKKKEKVKKEEVYYSKIRKPKIAISELSLVNFPNFLKYFLSVFLIGLGFLAGKKF